MEAVFYMRFVPTLYNEDLREVQKKKKEIFNNMLYVWNLYLTKGQEYS
jgi:hypothetical protein